MDGVFDFDMFRSRSAIRSICKYEASQCRQNENAVELFKLQGVSIPGYGLGARLRVRSVPVFRGLSRLRMGQRV